jgi:hypothetical protein
VSGRENIFNDLSKNERGKTAARAKECIFHFYLFAKNRLVLCSMMLCRDPRSPTKSVLRLADKAGQSNRNLARYCGSKSTDRRYKHQQENTYVCNQE